MAHDPAVHKRVHNILDHFWLPWLGSESGEPQECLWECLLSYHCLVLCVVLFRVVGLNRFITVNCAEPWALHILDGVKWTEYFNVAALLSFYFVVAIEVRRRNTSVGWCHRLKCTQLGHLDPTAFYSASAVQFFSYCVWFGHFGAICIYHLRSSIRSIMRQWLEFISF